MPLQVGSTLLQINCELKSVCPVIFCLVEGLIVSYQACVHVMLILFYYCLAIGWSRPFDPY